MKVQFYLQPHASVPSNLLKQDRQKKVCNILFVVKNGNLNFYIISCVIMKWKFFVKKYTFSVMIMLLVITVWLFLHSKTNSNLSFVVGSVQYLCFCLVWADRKKYCFSSITVWPCSRCRLFAWNYSRFSMFWIPKIFPFLSPDDFVQWRNDFVLYLSRVLQVVFWFFFIQFMHNSFFKLLDPFHGF